MANASSQIISSVHNANFPELLQKTSSWPQTASKISQFFTSMEGVSTIFSILAGIAIAVLWSVSIGLLVGAAGMCVVSIAIATCRNSSSKPKEEQKQTKPEDSSPVQKQDTAALKVPQGVFPLEASNRVESVILPIAKLWTNLTNETKMQLAGIENHDPADFGHRFSGNIFCPKETAIGFHANKVGKGISQYSFIASQAPLPADFEIFWKSILSENCSTIFDLTGRKDAVEKYYPNKLSEAKFYGSMSVQLVQVTGNTYTYEVADSVKGIRAKVSRFHYADWPDFGVVTSEQLDELVRKVEEHSPNPADLVWVHCRAGVGRTGTLITALILKEQIATGKITKKNLDVSLVEIVVGLRKQRGAFFVQQLAQLNLLREYATLLL